MFRLTEEELVVVLDECGGNPAKDHFYVMVLKTQMKKLLLGISKETKRLDGTTYLVPDYSKFKEALEEMNDV